MRPLSPSRRRRAKQLMSDRCVIRRPTDRMETDPETLEVVRVFEVVYDPDISPHKGRCKLQTYEGHETTRDVVSATEVQQRSSVHVPVGALVTMPGDVVTILESRDPLLVGESFRIVQKVPVKSAATAYRVFVDHNVGEEVPPWPTP